MEQQPEKLKPIGTWTVQDIEELPAIELDWLEYKASKWLTLDSSNLQEFSKYLSAFANFDGGYLVVGATNPSPGKPAELDEGVNFALKRDLHGWLEDKLPTLTDPKLPKIQIQPISLSPNGTRGLLVIYVPGSSEAPHQAHDHKFYTRIGTKLRALSTRAVFDIANRQKHPDVSAAVRLNLFYYNDGSGPRSHLRWEVTNNSDVLCLHIGLRIKMPMLYRGDAILFDPPAYIDQEGGAEYTILSADNGPRPLFPRSSVCGKIPLKGPDTVEWRGKEGKPKEVRTLQHIEVRVWADSAPWKDFIFAIDEVTKTFDL